MSDVRTERGQDRATAYYRVIAEHLETMLQDILASLRRASAALPDDVATVGAELAAAMLLLEPADVDGPRPRTARRRMTRGATLGPWPPRTS
jgi:hypothetical protein